MREERESHNKWLIYRHQEPLPVPQGFMDYLMPIVIIAMNTGFRRGSLFGLKWKDIDFKAKTISLPPSINKPTILQHFPANKKVIETLTAWQKQSADTSPDALVFPSPKSQNMFDNIRKSWASLLKDAKIENFRFHDLRHDFASQLVIKGVPLNTVRELLGHADMKMTLKYAHLSKEGTQEAVELLDTEK
jgi:integrase